MMFVFILFFVFVFYPLARLETLEPATVFRSSGFALVYQTVKHHVMCASCHRFLRPFLAWGSSAHFFL